jgi:hypothetical protein
MNRKIKIKNVLASTARAAEGGQGDQVRRGKCSGKNEAAGDYPHAPLATWMTGASKIASSVAPTDPGKIKFLD